jgi:hypothetical protein
MSRHALLLSLSFAPVAVGAASLEAKLSSITPLPAESSAIDAPKNTPYQMQPVTEETAPSIPHHLKLGITREGMLRFLEKENFIWNLSDYFHLKEKRSGVMPAANDASFPDDVALVTAGQYGRAPVVMVIVWCRACRLCPCCGARWFVDFCAWLSWSL